MRRLAKILGLCTAAISVAAVTAACGTQRISVPKSTGPAYAGAVLFSERCAGCHTLSYAATHGSAPNIRTAQAISGPNFDQRCERPIDRVLYAIENGGFSGAYMPQNIVVGQDAVDVAKFVATYAGRSAPREIGIPLCTARPVGTLPAGSGTTSPTATIAASSTTASASPIVATTVPAPASATKKAHRAGKRSSKKSAHS
jgi:mono/diheme cytochrome c family protein